MATKAKYLKYDGNPILVDYAKYDADGNVIGALKLASDDVLGGFYTGFTETGKSYAVKLDDDGKAYVEVPWVNTVYSLPTATASTLGGVKLGSDTTQTVAANAVTATTSRTYAIQKNASGQLVVNVPWTDANTSYEAATTSTLGLVKSSTDNLNVSVASTGVMTTNFTDAQKNTLNSGITSDKVSTYDGYATTIASKQDKLTFDATPTTSSSNPVTSSGVKTYVDKQIETVTELAEGKTAAYVIDSTATGNTLFNLAKTSTTDVVSSTNDITITGVDGTTVEASKLNVGDVIFTKSADIKDWYYAGQVSSAYTFYQIDSDSPSLTNYVNTLSGTASSGVVTGLSKSGSTLTVTSTSLATSSPTASGNATAFIDTVSQAANGKLTLTKKNIPTVSSTQAGLAPSGGSATTFLRGDGTWATPANDNDNTTYTFATGTSGDGTFTVTPSGGTAQVVTIVGADKIKDVSVTNSAPTLSWGGTSTIGTITVGSTSTPLTVKLPANPNTNTWRAIQVNGTQLLGTGTSTGVLNFATSGAGLSVSGASNKITFTSAFSVTDVTIGA